jgi:hypothetical protein
MRLKGVAVGVRNWKKWEKRRLQAERGISCWNIVGGAVLNDVEVNIMVIWVGDGSEVDRQISKWKMLANYQENLSAQKGN